MKLVILESPAKVARVKSYLGEGWKVEATRGQMMEVRQKPNACGMLPVQIAILSYTNSEA